ncbi:hypothetical protein MMON_19750 [Mycolicibacterium monacense]|uniref:Uncharacterized protein n=1 Tax=Mycolicibacterium monacense TaxID=85693 RepID=A0AAD1IUB8_MYCMB|nr:hypothetical protein MMON_19750 [Mycolicibacterium monacense]
MRNHHEDGWLAATWTHLRSSPVPFGETLWRHARSVADRRGAQKTQEAEIAAIAEDLLDRAAAGPQQQTKAERRVTGRTSAASAGRDWPDPTESSEHHGPSPSERAADNETFDDDGEMAEVIPCRCLMHARRPKRGDCDRDCGGGSVRGSPPADHDAGGLAAFC